MLWGIRLILLITILFPSYSYAKNKQPAPVAEGTLADPQAEYARVIAEERSRKEEKERQAQGLNAEEAEKLRKDLDAAQRALGDPNIARIRTMLAKAEGKIDDAASALADQMVNERAAEMSSNLFWLKGGGYGLGWFNLYIESQIVIPFKQQEWGDTARYRFALGHALLPYSFQVRTSLGFSLPIAYNGPSDFLCKSKVALVGRCLTPNDNDQIDWGTSRINGYFNIQAAYRVSDVFETRLGYGADIVPFAYTPIGEQLTISKLAINHVLSLYVGSTIWGAPVGLQIEGGTDYYVSPGGQEKSGSKVTWAFVVSPIVRSFKVRQQQQVAQ
jgi:hypothetical protein